MVWLEVTELNGDKWEYGIPYSEACIQLARDFVRIGERNLRIVEYRAE